MGRTENAKTWEEKMIIGIDFDGTIVDHCYPEIGESVPYAIEWIIRWQNAGAKLILWTMRSDGRDCGDRKNPLAEAVAWCKNNGIRFWGINTNPQQHTWTQSPKAYCHTYVDDAAIGCPLICPAWAKRPMVDWAIVGPTVMAKIEAENAKNAQ